MGTEIVGSRGTKTINADTKIGSGKATLSEGYKEDQDSSLLRYSFNFRQLNYVLVKFRQA